MVNILLFTNTNINESFGFLSVFYLFVGSVFHSLFLFIGSVNQNSDPSPSFDFTPMFPLSV